MAQVDIMPTAGVEYIWRTTTGGSAASVVVTGIAAPNWVKLTQTGTNFTGYYSTNGTTWTAMATNAISMTTNTYIGAVVCAHNNANYNTCTATLTNVVANP
jgi:regulation of enolase protein 1 (concanavalin A-like superfamily)